MKTIAFLLLTIYFASFGVESRRRKEKDDGKIIGGEYLSISKVPYQVSVQTEWGYHLCGGALIARKWVLTAAHCLFGAELEHTSIRAGSPTYEEGGQEIRAKKFIPHSNYQKSPKDNDIGLIELSKPMHETDKVKPIRLAKSRVPVNTELTVSGWGDTFENANYGSEYLQYVKVPVLSEAKCKDFYNISTSNMFCAGFEEGGKDACQGDSGGPAVANNTLYGIVSWGTGCGRKNNPGVYVEVANYLDWISEQTGWKIGKNGRLEKYKQNSK